MGKRKLTIEEVRKRFKEQNIELLSEYESANKKVLAKCLKCGYEWEVYPKHIFTGHSCPRCAGNRLSKDDILDRISKKDLELISDFNEIKNENSLVRVKCKKCGFEYETKLRNILRGKGGCRKCNRKNTKTPNRKSPFTQEEIKEKLREFDLELLSEFKNMRTKIKVKCLKCGYIREVRPNDIINRKRICPECARRKKMLSEDEVRKKFKEAGIELLSEYRNMNTKVKAKCLKCGYEWEVRPSNILKVGCSCPNCKNIERRLKLQEVIERFKDNNLELLSDYQNAHTKVKVRCVKCGRIFETYPYCVFMEKGCLICNTMNPKWEEEFREILESYGLEVKKRYQLNGRMEIDLFIPEFNIGIELNGLYWHGYSPFIHNSFKDNQYKAKWHLHRKKMLALEKGIDVIFVFEHEYYNKFIFNKILDFILCKIGLKQEHKVYARDCDFVEIDNQSAFEFYEKYHILGKPTYCKHFGLVSNGKLLSMLSFRKEKSEWIITRYCIHPEYRIIGGFQKLLKNSIKHLNINLEVEPIVTFGDLRFVNPKNNVFVRNGFKIVHYVEPRYFYWKGDVKNPDKLIILERREAQKSKLKKLLGELFDENLTEEENMFKYKFVKCYDAGKIKMKYNP